MFTIIRRLKKPDVHSINCAYGYCTKTVNPENVPGLSKNVFRTVEGEIGPGASKTGEYKNPEYFSYHKESYFDAEIEMLKYRLPQPSSQKKSN